MAGIHLQMDKYDQTHTKDDVAVAYVKDFNTGEWLNAKDAHYVVRSTEMGPMSQEFVSFKNHMAAMKFHTEKGGRIVKYSEINLTTVKGSKEGQPMGGHNHKPKSQ